MMTFKLGVENVSYLSQGFIAKNKDAQNQTTGEAADSIEKQNSKNGGKGVMQCFVEMMESEGLADMIGQAYLDKVQSGTNEPIFCTPLQERFKQEILNQQFNGKIKQAPNKSALMNRSRFKKHQRIMNTPLFDSGMYIKFFRAWL